MCKNIEEDRENTYNLKCWVLRKVYTGKSQFIEANYISVLLTMEVERREICLECLLMNSLAH